MEKNPITEALLQVYDSRTQTAQARLKFEQMQAKEALIARGAVPGVFAELTKREQKRQKQEQQIAKSGEGQQASPQAMVPPTVDVTGQTAGRDPAQALKSASEIFRVESPRA